MWGRLLECDHPRCGESSSTTASPNPAPGVACFRSPYGSGLEGSCAAAGYEHLALPLVGNAVESQPAAQTAGAGAYAGGSSVVGRHGAALEAGVILRIPRGALGGTVFFHGSGSPKKDSQKIEK